MVYTKISIHNRSIEPRLKAIEKKKNISEKEKNKIKEFLKLASIGKINLRKKISETRLLKYLDLLIIPLNYFKTDLDKITIKGMEEFIESLDKDKIKRKNKQPYSHSTKTDIKRILKIYLKWRIKDITRFNKLTNWFDLSKKFKTPDYLKESEIEKLYKSCSTNKQRFLVAVLFDSGCRAEEFLNIRFEDIIEPSVNCSYYKIQFKEEYSKTNGRNIGLYWKYSTEAIKDYLLEIRGLKPNEPVCSDTYDSLRMFVNRLGKKLLKRRVYLHLFRHSSATYYASKMNRQQLCLRYGWKFTSRMPDIYISRAGLEEVEIGEKFKETEIKELNTRLDKTEHLLKILLDKGKETMLQVETKLKKK